LAGDETEEGGGEGEGDGGPEHQSVCGWVGGCGGVREREEEKGFRLTWDMWGVCV
jgi:hypothetical protein